MCIRDREEDSESSIDFNICPRSVIIISDDSTTWMSTNTEMIALFGEESMRESSLSDTPMYIDEIMDGVEWGEEIDPKDIFE